LDEEEGGQLEPFSWVLLYDWGFTAQLKSHKMADFLQTMHLGCKLQCDVPDMMIIKLLLFHT